MSPYVQCVGDDFFVLVFGQVCYVWVDILCYLIESNCSSRFTVYGFQNNLAPTSGTVLTASGANVNANLGGTAAWFLTVPTIFWHYWICCLHWIYKIASLLMWVFICVCETGYGVQKNVSSGGGGVVSTGVSSKSTDDLGKSYHLQNNGQILKWWSSLSFLLSSATRSQTEDAYKKDYKFLISEKENVAAKRDAEMLILAKDSGKQFTTTTTTSGGGIQVGGGESDIHCPLVEKNSSLSLTLTGSQNFLWTQEPKNSHEPRLDYLLFKVGSWLRARDPQGLQKPQVHFISFGSP